MKLKLELIYHSIESPVNSFIHFNGICPKRLQWNKRNNCLTLLWAYNKIIKNILTGARKRPKGAARKGEIGECQWKHWE
jgi:hypothetical protein